MHGPNYDCREEYELAMRKLKKDPNAADLKHKAVLALARAGSLVLAKREYERFDLHLVDDDEEIMGLGARLLKDEFLVSGPHQQQKFARLSASRYLEAYQSTGGYYSGINAATMDLLSGGDIKDVERQAAEVLENLPDPTELSSRDRYFVLATSAEAHLLQSRLQQARAALLDAWQFEPMNFHAQASTLRQLRLICGSIGLDCEWLQPFQPPRCIHYAGHSFSIEGDAKNYMAISTDTEATIESQLSEVLQENDVGFGYGALSAGADILFAEALLSEGAELHIVLPTSASRYLETSVTPYGDGWVSRFENCFSAANSVTILRSDSKWPGRELNRYAGKVSMGQAILQAGTLGTSTLQILALDPTKPNSYSADHQRDWQRHARESVLVSIRGRLPKRPLLDEGTDELQVEIVLASSANTSLLRFQNMSSAVEAALNSMSEADGSIKIGLHCGFAESRKAIDEVAIELAAHAVPGGIAVSEVFASLLAVDTNNEFSTTFTGRLNVDSDFKITTFGLSSVTR